MSPPPPSVLDRLILAPPLQLFSDVTLTILTWGGGGGEGVVEGWEGQKFCVENGHNGGGGENFQMHFAVYHWHFGY